MSIVAFIFARGGSKGLPGKNILNFAGKPLIVWAIEQAKSIPRIDNVIVSTDSDEIAEIANMAGAEVPYLRPKSLASDHAPEWMAWRHALNNYKNSEGAYPKVMLSLPATSPLRSLKDIENCLDVYETANADAVIGITDAHRNPFFNMVVKNSNQELRLVMDSNGVVYRRQDADKVYDLTTVAYAIRPDFIFTCESLFEGVVKSFYVPQERAVDIDTAFDFKVAELIFMSKRS
jgi:CMP-N-acetylneuraminic acid synthetase